MAEKMSARPPKVHRGRRIPFLPVSATDMFLLGLVSRIPPTLWIELAVDPWRAFGLLAGGPTVGKGY